MGARGPVPKRSSERRRRNSAPVTQVSALAVLREVPAPPAGLHALAADWYASLALSGQSQFYEPSDWQVARILAVVMTRLLNAPQLSAPLLTVILQGWRDLLATEGVRRRAGIEVTRPLPAGVELPGITAIEEVRARLTKGGRR